MVRTDTCPNSVKSVAFLHDDALATLSADSLHLWRAPTFPEIDAASRSK